jgi:hypothetical protein
VRSAYPRRADLAVSDVAKVRPAMTMIAGRHAVGTAYRDDCLAPAGGDDTAAVVAMLWLCWKELRCDRRRSSGAGFSPLVPRFCSICDHCFWYQERLRGPVSQLIW